MKLFYGFNSVAKQKEEKNQQLIVIIVLLFFSFFFFLFWRTEKGKREKTKKRNNCKRQKQLKRKRKRKKKKKSNIHQIQLVFFYILFINTINDSSILFFSSILFQLLSVLHCFTPFFLSFPFLSFSGDFCSNKNSKKQ